MTRITERFQVATVTGYRITGSPYYPSRAKGPGISAHVVDTERNYGVIVSFRSEDRVPLFANGGYRGVEATLEAAHAEADRLNSEDAAPTA
jgi:hypothetical protein